MNIKIYYNAKKRGLTRIKHIENKTQLIFKDRNKADAFKVWLELNYPLDFDAYIIDWSE